MRSQILLGLMGALLANNGWATNPFEAEAREPQAPRRELRRILVYPPEHVAPYIHSAISTRDNTPPLAQSMEQNPFDVHPSRSNPLDDFADETLAPPLLSTLTHTTQENDTIYGHLKDDAALEKSPLKGTHKRVEMLRQSGGEPPVSQRSKRMREAKIASADRDESVPILPATSPSPLLSAQDCRVMTARLYEESQNPHNPTLVAAQLLESAKIHALHVIIRDPKGVTPLDLEVVADLMFESCDYKWATVFYTQAIERDPSCGRETYARLIASHEELGDLEDARRAAKALVRHSPDATREDNKKLKSLTRQVFEDRYLHDNALSSGHYKTVFDHELSRTEEDDEELF